MSRVFAVAVSACALAAPTAAQLIEPAHHLLEEAGVRLFGVDDPAERVEHFRRHRIAVAAIDRAPRTAGREWSLALVYPSVNFGGEGGGSTVWYSHEAVVVPPPDAAAELAGIDWERVLLILEPRFDDGHTYDLVGTASRTPRADAEMDWFADKQALLYRGNRASPPLERGEASQR